MGKIILNLIIICFPICSIAGELGSLFQLDEDKLNQELYELSQLESVIENNIDTTAFNNELYDLGILDAIEYYDAPLTYYGAYLLGYSSSFVTGMVGAIIGETAGCVIGAGCFAGALLPLGYTVISGVFSANINKYIVSDKQLLDKEDYLKGYQKTAKRKKLKGALIGSAIGMFVGITTAVLFYDAVD
ncbi:MAG: hypothetical protein JKX95_07760 [Bacteroidia bacterium]|nr:hypothetical protein [Bacteroidia bacterium]